MNEMPSISAGTYASQNFNMMAALANAGQLGNQAQQLEKFFGAQQVQPVVKPPLLIKANLEKENTMSKSPRRLVQVFIADPDDNVPLVDSLLHSGEQKLTDLTDQELFFEIDIRSILAAHNEKRVKLVNKAVKERTEYLEPARIRDLKMTVVSIATF